MSSMQKIPYDSSVPKADIAQFRMWQDFTLAELYEIVNRSPLAYYLAFGIVEEAYQYGFMVVDNEGEKHEKDREIQDSEYYDEDLQALTMAVGNARTYGANNIWFKEFQEKWTFLNYTTGDIPDHTSFTVEFDDKFKIIKTELKMKVGSKATDYTITDNEELFLFVNEKGPKFRGRSELEAIFDNLFAETILMMQLILYIIRIGSGVHKLLVNESLFGDNPQSKALFKNLKGQLDKMGLNTKLMFPKEIDGVETSYELYTGTGGSVNFKEAHTVLLTPIASKTGIPLEKLRGESTAFASTEVHQSQYFQQLVKIRTKFKDMHKWKISKRYDMELDSFGIDYKINPELSEKEKTESNYNKLDALSKLDVNQLADFGISPERLMTFLDIDIEIDEALISKREVERQTMRDAFESEDETDDTEDDDDEEEDESEQ